MTLQEWFKKKDYGIGLALLGTYSKNRILLQNLARKQNPAKLEYELRKIAGMQGIDLSEKKEDPKDKKVKTLPLNQSGSENDKNDQSQSDQIKAEKLGSLESDAEDIVQENIDELKSAAQDIVEEKISEFEYQVDEILAGKLEVVRDGKNVKYEDLSPEMKARWDQNRDAYKEVRATHEKLKLMEKGTPEDRQPLTQRICDLDDLIRDNWAEIDAFIPGSDSSDNTAAIDHKRIQANRKYISTNLKKLPEVQDTVKVAKTVAELQLRFDELKSAGETVTQETIDELTKVGVKC